MVGEVVRGEERVWADFGCGRVTVAIAGRVWYTSKLVIFGTLYLNDAKS
jgi:hypothetical protein